MTAYNDFSVTTGNNIPAGNQNQNMINIRHIVNGTDATASPVDSLISLRTSITTNSSNITNNSNNITALQSFSIYSSVSANGSNGVIGYGSAYGTEDARILIPLPNGFSDKPNTLTVTSTDWQLFDGSSTPIGATVITLLTDSTKRFGYLRVQVSSGLTQFRPYFLIGDGAAERTLTLSVV